MMALFDPCSITVVADFLKCANDYTGDLWWVAMLMSFFIVAVLNFRIQSFEKAVTAAFFISTLLAIPMKGLGIISESVLYIYMIGTIVSASWLFYNRR